MKYKLTLLLLTLCSFTNYAQDKESKPALSIHRLSGGLSLNTGSFFLQGSDNGIELMAVDINRTENSTKSKSFGVGFSLNYTIIKPLDIVFDNAIEYSNETLVDSYWIKSNNFGLKYQVISFDKLSPFIKVSYSRYSVGEISVYDATLTTIGKKGQYIWRGNGLTAGLGLELKIGKILHYSLGYDKLFTIGNIVADEGGVVFENKPKHGRFNFTFRISF